MRDFRGGKAVRRAVGALEFDFTDSANPHEIAYFDRGPIDEKELVLGGYWSSYWYHGRLFNPQQQFPVTWPAEPVVARAYVDQLKRGSDVPAATLAELDAALGAAAATPSRKSARRASPIR